MKYIYMYFHWYDISILLMILTIIESETTSIDENLYRLYILLYKW